MSILWGLLIWVCAAVGVGFAIAANMISGNDQFGEGAVAALLAAFVLSLATD